MTILRRLFRYSLRYWQSLALGYICLLVVTLFNLVVPRLLKEVIDRGLYGRDGGFVLVAALLVILINVCKGVFAFGRVYFTEFVSQRVAYDLRNELYDRLQHLSFAYHDRAQTGEIMSRATSDVDQIRLFSGQGILHIINTVLLMALILVIMFSMHARLALLSLLIVPPLAFTAISYGTHIRPMFGRVQQQFAIVAAVLQENIAGVRVVKAFAREDYEIEKFRRENQLLIERNLRAMRAWAFVQPLFPFLTGLGTVLLLWSGGRDAINGEISVGTLVAFNSYLMMLAQPVRQLGWIINVVSRAVASGERIFEILDARSPVQEKPGAIALGRSKGHVVFEHVHFAYHSGLPVLHDITFEARPGQVIGLVGATGSGKTTIVNLIPRFYDVTSGRVLVDGHDVRDVTLESLRRNIGIVLQDPFLFSASVAENIAYGRPDATMDEIIAAAKAAQAHDFIMRLEDGYNTHLGERGVNLSGGQRQRISIARALCMDPRILILDDATSSVDMETEHLIQQALKTLLEGRTTFIIAQRLTSVKDADLILVLDRGRIVERGTHDELVRRGGIYARIYALQLRDQEELTRQRMRQPEIVQAGVERSD
ncbi:MAG: ABC transporter ATP-binding protein [Chloroflexota bacterium]